MSISTAALDALQSAGAAAFAAQMELQKSADVISEQIQASLKTNAFDVGNDALFEDWKKLARLAQTVTHIEAELRKVYAVAQSTTGAQKVRGALPAGNLVRQIPSSLPLEMVSSVDATDAHVKEPKIKTPQKYTKSTKTGKALKAGVAQKAGKPIKAKPRGARKVRPLVGNTAKLLEYLRKKLEGSDFTKVNRTLLATEVGLPKGSIGASVSKLLEHGHIVQDSEGRLKLA